jgi:hypothetical protein
VFQDVLLADEAHRENPARRERDGRFEELWQQMDTSLWCLSARF